MSTRSPLPFHLKSSHTQHSGENWHGFLKRFATSVQHITGQELEIDEASNHLSSHLVEEELESLRNKVEELSDEVCFGSLPCTKLTFIVITENPPSRETGSTVSRNYYPKISTPEHVGPSKKVFWQRGK